MFGKAQDLLLYLGSKNINLSIHRSIHKYIEPFSEFGFEFKNTERFRANDIKNKVVVFPIHKRSAKI